MASRKSKTCHLTPAALDDLDEIWAFSAETWSVSQAETYLSDLGLQLQALCDYPEIARERQELSPPVRIHRFRSHVVLYRIDGDRLVVFRVVHARRDWSALLQE